MRGSPLIQEVVAERQLQVICKGFNFLMQEENNALYIADEVGLGKTYIALGIASLMRHFSSNPEHYQDVIVVPKENLQLKWEKEIRQFVRNNYKLYDNRVKSVIGKPNGDIVIMDKLGSIKADIPGYHIYRTSSFSFGLSFDLKRDILEHLCNGVASLESIEFLNRAKELGYLSERNKPLLKKLYAYILSTENPPIELLIVDEGHNYKSGPGLSENEQVADRNNVVARFFGIKMNTEEDRKIFEDFPDLKRLIKPKVQKLIVLSATPKTTYLQEIKNQLNCFLPSHILSDVKKEEEIKEKLPYFLIRGKMQYRVKESLYSRNLCRFEHRNGNVIKAADAPPLTLEDDEQVLFMGLLQYSTIRHLNKKHNATFEMGMLAGFETFLVDNRRKSEEVGEYEEVRTRKTRESQDQNVLRGVLNSWQEEFGTLPPHPKQTAIVDAVFNMMKSGEKSLIFVRRVASAYELEKRLLDRWEQEVIGAELEKVWKKKLPSQDLNVLMDAFEEYVTNKEINEKLENIIGGLGQRILERKRDAELPFMNEAISKGLSPAEVIKTGLFYLYRNYKSIPSGLVLRDFILRQVKLSSYKNEFVTLAKDLLNSNFNNWKNVLDAQFQENFEEEEEAYFFHQYFRTPGARNFRRQRIYSADWFDLNCYQINQHFRIASFNSDPLKKDQIHAKDIYNITEVQEIFLKHLREEDYTEHQIVHEEFPNALIERRTLITELYIRIFEKEIQHFIDAFKGQSKETIFHELKTLTTIIKGSIRNGSGFLPLFIADHADGEFIDNYISIITDKDSIFKLVTLELKTIINDYALLRAVNFPDGESPREIESKLVYQSPIKGLSGIKKNKSKWATQFRMPGFPYVLITTDIFREGEDLHTYCQNIYHYGIAWNCTDMEQRTGRIDRINSLSHRKMNREEIVAFNTNIHVFYPYIKKTLEVNQVNRLFNSINSFVQAFDIVDTIEVDGIAGVGDVVSEIPQVIKAPMRSQFEYDQFKGFTGSGKQMKINSLLGTGANEVESFLIEIIIEINKMGSFYMEPTRRLKDFEIVGDFNLTERDNRRGPFSITVKNDEIPGKFIIQACSYLFKKSSRVQRAIFEHHVSLQEQGLDLINIDDYYAIAFTKSIYNIDEAFYKKLYHSIILADEIEKMITDDDVNVFG